MILLLKKNLEVFLLEFEKFYKDLQQKDFQSVIRKGFSQWSVRLAQSNRYLYV